MTSPSSSQSQIPVQLILGGEIPYREAWALQEQVHQGVVAGKPSALILCSHPHVMSMGSQTKRDHMLLSDQAYQAMGAEVVKTNRGGDVTYHGPGQLIAYPIFRLADFSCGEDLHRFLRGLEDVLIDMLAHFGLEAGRKEGKTGVWIADLKVAAIGLRASRWVTMHGLALNNTTDLSWFEKIVPCGLSEGVTSLALEGIDVDTVTLQEALLASFSRVFGIRFERED